MSHGPPLLPEHAAAVLLIRAGNRTNTATEEAARTRLGFVRLTKSRKANSDADRVFAELVHERFCRPRPTAVSGPLDTLRQAFVDRTLEVSLHTTSKAAVGVAFVRVTHYKPTGQDAKARKATTDKRRAATTTAAAPPPLLRPPSHMALRDHHRRSDGVARRADTFSSLSPFISHRVRRRW
jgi:hypothetical protein